MSALRVVSRRVRAVVKAATKVDALPPADHRPWPLPREPWIMTQTWSDLLFAHWPVQPAAVRPLVPAGLILDTFDGLAWIGITPFVVSRLRLRGAPAIPGASSFPELNVRTYVRRADKPGVFFFSLDAGSRLAVTAARWLYALPYFRAAFTVTTRNGWIHYACRRTHRRAVPAECDVTYRPCGPQERHRPGELGVWLTERYCLYAIHRERHLYRAEIHHPPWPLQVAEADFRRNTMTAALGFPLPDAAPLTHFARRLDVHVWAPHSVETDL